MKRSDRFKSLLKAVSLSILEANLAREGDEMLVTIGMHSSTIGQSQVRNGDFQKKKTLAKRNSNPNPSPYKVQPYTHIYHPNAIYIHPTIASPLHITAQFLPIAQ